VLFGNRRIPGKIAEILPVSGVYAGTQQPLTGNRPATQIARIRFDADALPPPLNSTVDVRMHYSDFSARIATHWSISSGFIEHDAANVAPSATRCRLKRIKGCARLAGAEGLEMFPVLHHMMCAYVGPQYDFAATAAGYVCPKCRREIVSGDPACEIVGTSARCVRCSKEMMVSPPTVSP
jgi:hypothetical protein